MILKASYHRSIEFRINSRRELEARLSVLSIHPMFIEDILSKQQEYPKIIKLWKQVSEGKVEAFTVQMDGRFRFKGRWCVRDGCDLLKLLLNESHSSSYLVHPGGNKMYQDLKLIFLVVRYEEEHFSVCFQVLNLLK